MTQDSSGAVPKIGKPFSSTLLKWIFAGYFIRLIIMPLIVTNFDLVVIAESSFILKETHQLIPSAFPEPIIYFFASILSLFGSVLPKMVFTNVLTNTAFTPPTLSLTFLLSNPDLLAYTYLFKMIYLAFDFLLGLFLLRIAKEHAQGSLAFKLWMVNPVVIYVSYAIGQFDIIPVFLFTLALYYMQLKKTKTAMLLLGIAGALKFFAFVFALPFAIMSTKNLKKTGAKVKGVSFLLLISLLPIVLGRVFSTLTPIYYESANMAAYPLDVNGFFGTALYNRGTTGQPFLIGISTFLLDYSLGFRTLASFYDVIYLFAVIYILFLLFLIYKKDVTFNDLWKTMLMILLAYYAISLFHPQWFLWIQPFLILLVLEDFKKFFKVFLLLISLYFIYVLYWAPDILAIIDKTGFPGYQVINVLRSVFSALCIFTIFLMLKSRGTLKKLMGGE